MANEDKPIHTGGGASVGKSVQTGGGDFVGRDHTNITINIINWTELGAEFIKDLNNALQSEQKKQEKLEKEQKLGSRPDPIIQGRIDKLNQKITELDHFKWSNAEQAYLNKVIKLYDRVRILGNSEDVPLGNIFTQVYILDKPTARQRHDIDELRNQGNDRLDFQRQPGERTDGVDLVKTSKNLFILGKPGAGKTTFLRYITIQAAAKQLPRIPIFVSLNLWADSKWGKGANVDLLPFIVEQFAICDFPDAELFIGYILKEGRALVLFDGLDEVKQEKDQRRRLTHLLQDFANKYDKSQHLITCRIAASDYAFAGFADVEVADFTGEQVREYARHWFGEQDKKFEAFSAELAKPENRGLAELCNTPLLLSLLCLTFDNTMRFPPSRAELYEDALETLLRKWDSNREIQRDEIYRTLSHKRKLQLLMSIAVPAFEKGELFFRQRNLEKWIVDYLIKLPGAPPADTLDGTAILKAIEAQHSILVERAQGIYSFSHLTFQEYLTARYLAENQGGEVTGRLIHDHLTDPRWREVFLLTASLLDNADAFVAAMQHALHGIVVNAPTTSYLLTWAYDRAREANAPVERRYVVQLAYIFLARALALARALVLARSLDLDRQLAPALALTLALAQARDLEQARELALALARARALARVLALDRSLDRALAHDLAQDRERVRDIARDLARATILLMGFDYGLYYSWTYATIFVYAALDHTNQDWQDARQQLPSLIEGVAGLAGEAGLTGLAQRLAVLPCPLLNASAQEWQQYADILFAILRDERDLGREWDLNDKESNKLNDYFYANELLVECLKIAVVSDRQAVLNGLLLPPGVGEADKMTG